MPTTIKKYYPYYKRYYSGYSKNRFYRRYKNYVGKNNYFNTRADISGTISFPTSTGPVEIKVGSNTYPAVWVYGILNSVNPSLLGSFDQRKVNGFRLQVLPANDRNMGTDSSNGTIVTAGITHDPSNSDFNRLVDNNKSVILNPMGKTQAYWPVRNNWTSNDANVHDDGCFAVFSNRDNSDMLYGRVYSFKLSVYVTYRNSSRF